MIAILIQFVLKHYVPKLLPLLLLAHLGGSQWALSFALPVVMRQQETTQDSYPEDIDLFGYRFDGGNQSLKIASYVLMASNILLSLAWFLPLVACYYSTYVVAPRFSPSDAPERAVKRVDLDRRQKPVPRRCHSCAVTKHDRTSHCRHLPVDRCLPFYDHWCPFWQGAIWAHNVKPYLIFTVWLPVYQIFCLVVASWALSKPEYRNVMGSQILVLLLGALTGYFSARLGWQAWSQLVASNYLFTDGDKKQAFLVQGTDTIKLLDLAVKDENPWDLGFWRNLTLLMGPWRNVLWFWIPSSIFFCEVYPDNGILSAPEPIPLQSIMIDRRREATSNSVEEGEDVARRRNLAAATL